MAHYPFQHGWLKNNEPIPPKFLGAVHGYIGVAQHIICQGVPCVAEHDANTDRYKNPASSKVNRFVQTLQNALCNPFIFQRCFQVFQ
ncbi:hypothetical protein SDC9_92886 [bioreactor metagenome]|uniref:Uncharacterized protein n=1 Tax=bioreactor metagenome TaxID=1076179 RepID=A0A645A0E1_9ZZZZ